MFQTYSSCGIIKMTNIICSYEQVQNSQTGENEGIKEKEREVNRLSEDEDCKHAELTDEDRETAVRKKE